MVRRTSSARWRIASSSLALAVTVGGLGGPALAQERSPPPPDAATSTLDEIVVTARRREESLQTVPVSIDYIPSETLESNPTFDVYDLARAAPGLTLNASVQRQNVNFSIRGQNRTGGTLASAVIPYFAEVPLSRLSQGEFYDLSGVQVLKGPQGTLFGKVTGGGAVLLEPERPSDRFEGYVDLRAGDYDLRGFRAAVNIPILDDRVALRLAGDITRRDGYTLNLFNGEYLDDVSYEGARATLLVRPNDRFETSTIISFSNSDQNGSGTVFAGYNPFTLGPALSPIAQFLFNAQQARGPRVTNIGATGPLYVGDDGIYFQRESTWVLNRTRIDLADNLTLRNIFGWVRTEERGGSSVVGEALQLSMNTARFTPNVDVEQFSEELQLQGTAWNGLLDFTTGLYVDYSRNPNLEGSGAILFASQQLWTAVDRTVRSHAVYAQGTFDLEGWVPGLKLDAGLRYSEDSVKGRNAQYLVLGLAPAPVPYGQCLGAAEIIANHPGVIPLQPCTAFEQNSDALTYTLALNYQINPDTFAYASLRRGYRPGGVNSNGSGGGTLPILFAPEYVTSREVGLKADWTLLGVPVRTNLAAFWDEGRDIQQSVLGLSGGPVSTPVSGVANAAETRTLGLEFDGMIRPTDNLTLSFNWAYTDSEFGRGGLTDAQLAAACPANPLTTAPAANGLYCPLKDVPLTPRNAGGFAVRYQLPVDPAWGELAVSADYYYTARSASDNSNIPVTATTPFGGYTPAYEVVNLNLELAEAFGRPIDLRLFATNLFDKTYVQANAGFLEAGSLGASGVYYGPPRMIGVSLRYRFGS